MARIPEGYRASKMLTTDGAIDTHLTDYVGRATESLGASISDAASQFGQRMEQRETFKANQGLQRFKLDRNQDLLDQAANEMPEGGIGFHDTFMGSFKTKRDEFLKTVPERLRGEFSSMLDDENGPVFGEFSNAAALKERDETVSWAKTEVAATQDQLTNAINLNPEKYDELLATGNKLIDTMPMVAPSERLKFKQQWENMAQVAHLAALQEQDPELVLKALGAPASRLSPTTQFAILAEAVQGQESGGDPNAVSSKGALGTHQVMPGTARDIAKAIGDANFPFNGDPSEVAQYMLRPGMSKKYGEFYLKAMMRKFPGDLEAALIAYHSGPGKAEEWVKTGRSDAVLGPEGKAYYKEVIARLPGASNDTENYPNLVPVAQANAFLKTRLAPQHGPEDIDGMQPGMQSRLAAMMQAAPPDIGKGLGIFSGKRSAERQRALWEKSDKTGKWVARPGHSMHESGAAADLSWNGKSLKDAPPDVREWVHKNAERFGLKFPMSHEPWHIEMAETRGGKPPMHLSGRYASLPFDKRQQFIVAADNALTQRLTQQRQADSVARVQLTQGMQNELALIKSTGNGSGNFDDAQVQQVLGDDDLIKWVDKKQEAQQTFTAISDMKTMSPDEIGERIDDYQPDPSGDRFDDQVRVHAAVVREAERISNVRARSPDKAALEDPIVKQAQQKVIDAAADGTADPASMQEFIQLMLQRQRDFGVTDKALAPIPRSWGFQIAKALQRIPELSKDTKIADVRAAVAVQYEEAKTVFGDYTDEVILYSLSQYKNLSPDNAKMIVSWMESIAHGGNPFKPTADIADQAQVESVGIWDSITNYFSGERGTAEEVPIDGGPEASPPSPELVQRARDAMSGDPEDFDSPEEEAVLVERYGQAAVDAAKLSIEQGAQ